MWRPIPHGECGVKKISSVIVAVAIAIFITVVIMNMIFNSITIIIIINIIIIASINGMVITPPTLCIGAPVLHYVMGGGWELCTQSVIVKGIRDNRYRGTQLVTLN